MNRTLRRLFGLFVGYALAVIVASIICCMVFAGWAALFRPEISKDFFQTIIIGGTLITASTAWPGYLITSWLLLSKRLVNKPSVIAMAGALTAVQALLFMSFFVQTIANLEMWVPAVTGGFIGALVFSLCAESLFGMHFKEPSQSPSSSKS